MMGEIEERRRVDLLEFVSAGGSMVGESQTIIEAYLSHAFRKPDRSRWQRETAFSPIEQNSPAKGTLDGQLSD